MTTTGRCPVCRNDSARVDHPADFIDPNLGLTGIRLQGEGVVTTECDACGNATTLVMNQLQLLESIALAIVIGRQSMTGEQLTCVRKLCGLTQKDVAGAIGLTRRETVAEWEANGPQAIFARACDELPLRVALLAAFERWVRASDECLLSGAERQRLAEHLGDFARHASRFLRYRHGAGAMQAEGRGAEDGWCVAFEADAAAKRLSELGGTEPDVTAAPRRRW
jgi:DNA-binding XRE family transcriptional regulator